MNFPLINLCPTFTVQIIVSYGDNPNKSQLQYSICTIYIITGNFQSILSLLEKRNEEIS